MRLNEAMKIEPLSRGTVVAGAAGLQRAVDGIHVVDLPNPERWLTRNRFLLTTGFSWSHDDRDLRRMIADLDGQGVAGIGLAVPGYFDESPRAIREAANRVGLPVIEIPWEIPFFEISEQINRAMLSEQQLISQRSEAVHRELTRAAIEAKSLGEIMQVLADLIQRAVTLEDPDGNLIAAHGDTRLSDPIRQETLARGGSVPRIAERLREIGVWARILHARKPLRIPAQPDLGFSSRVACPVWLKDEFVAVVWIIEGDTPLGDLDFRAAEHAAIITALHIARDRAVVSVETRLGNSLVDLLLEGQFQENTQSLERALRLGFDPTRVYCIALFAFDETTPLGTEGMARRDRLVRRLENRLSAHDVPALLSASLNHVSIMLPEEIDAEQLWEQLRDPGLRLCIGRAHAGIAGVRKSYLEARSMLSWVGAGQSATYESFLVPRLLKGDRAARREFVDDLLGLLVHPRQGQNERILMQTLLMLGAHGFNQTETAERLGIHIKTMHYRLRRLQELTGKDFSDPETRFRVQLLGHIIDMESRENAHLPDGISGNLTALRS